MNLILLMLSFNWILHFCTVGIHCFRYKSCDTKTRYTGFTRVETNLHKLKDYYWKSNPTASEVQVHRYLFRILIIDVPHLECLLFFCSIMWRRHGVWSDKTDRLERSEPDYFKNFSTNFAPKKGRLYISLIFPMITWCFVISENWTTCRF